MMVGLSDPIKMRPAQTPLFCQITNDISPFIILAIASPREEKQIFFIAFEKAPDVVLEAGHAVVLGALLQVRLLLGPLVVLVKDVADGK